MPLNKKPPRHIDSKDADRKLLLKPAFRCDIVDRVYDHDTISKPKPRPRPRPKSSTTPQRNLHRQRQTPLVRQIHRERYLRTLKKAFSQCTCPIRNTFLKPVGQALQFTLGISKTGEAPGVTNRKSRTQFMPLELMDTEQRKSYKNITGVVCWWCTYPIEGPGVGCPVEHKCLIVPNHRRKRSEPRHGFRFIGFFCSWPCACAYGKVHLSKDAHHINEYIHMVVMFIVRKLRSIGKLEQNFKVPSVKPAPHFTLLDKFGGSHTIEEFRRITELDNGNKLTIMPDWIPCIPAGMKVIECPSIPRSFADEFNLGIITNDDTFRENIIFCNGDNLITYWKCSFSCLE